MYFLYITLQGESMVSILVNVMYNEMKDVIF